MEESKTLIALAALAQVQRLRAFRALVVAGRQGLTPSAIGEQLGVSPSALSFHLKALAHAGLVRVEPCGRNLIYQANFDTMNGVLGYLTEHCCQGIACETHELVACVACDDNAVSVSLSVVETASR